MDWFSKARANTHEIGAALHARLHTLAEEDAFTLKGLLHDGCRHRHLSWPQDGEQTCLDCSARWSYDWAHMHRGPRREVLGHPGVLAMNPATNASHPPTRRPAAPAPHLPRQAA